MDEPDIPSNERDKLFPFVPVSIIPVLVFTLITLGILLFDFSGNYSTNPVVFYSIPLLYALTFLVNDSFPVILSVIGAAVPTLRSKIVAAISVPIGWFVGWGLVSMAMAKGSIFKIATYPWAVTSLATVGTLSTFTTSTSFALYFFVALFEEIAAIIMGKNAANWLHSKGMNGIPASLLGYLLGRIALTSHHWFSYGGLREPSLYLSAMFMFTLFTIMGLIFGILMKGFKDELSDYKVIPISIFVMMAAHLAFDFVMSQLMVFVRVALPLLHSLPLV